MKKILILLSVALCSAMTGCTTTTPGEAIWNGTQAVHGFVSGTVGTGVAALESTVE